MCTIDGMTFHAPPCICTAAWTYLAKKFGADQATQYNFCVSVSPRKVIEDWPLPGSLHRSQCEIL